MRTRKFEILGQGCQMNVVSLHADPQGCGGQARPLCRIDQSLLDPHLSRAASFRLPNLFCTKAMPPLGRGPCICQTSRQTSFSLRKVQGFHAKFGDPQTAVLGYQ
jgi:hypothetical protein